MFPSWGPSLSKEEFYSKIGNYTDRGVDTMLYSVYAAYNGIKSNKSDEEISSDIHDAWAIMSLKHFNFGTNYDNEVNKRQHQFVFYKDLSSEDKMKDDIIRDFVRQQIFQ
jgi:hypothetical protein